jgi:DNA-binding MarR family transcriptional regulator
MDDTATVREAIAQIIAAQHSIARCMFQSSAPDWTQLDLTMGQLRTLMALAADGPMTVSALAEALSVSKPTASILIDRLVQAGDADRTEDPLDRRRTLVALTEAGTQLVARLREGKSERYERWLAAMHPDDLAALTRGIRALAAIAEQGDHNGLTTAPPGDARQHTALSHHTTTTTAHHAIVTRGEHHGTGETPDHG